MDQKFLSIGFDSWSELSGALMANRKLVQKILVPHATAERGLAVILISEYVWLIENCDKDQLQFHMHFTSKHTICMVFAK